MEQEARSHRGSHHHKHKSSSTFYPSPTLDFSPSPTISSLPTSRVAAMAPNNTTSSLYFQQTTTSMLSSTVAVSFLVALACLVLFSWVRTKRSSIYGSRQFFLKEEHRAEALPSGFFGWIQGLLFLERELASQQLKKTEGGDKHGDTAAPLTFWRRIWRQYGFSAISASSQRHEVGEGSEEKTGVDNTRGTRTKQALIAKIGLDHYLLVRFLRMLFSLSATVSILAFFVLVPLYTVAQSGEDPLSQHPLAPPRIEKMHIGNVTDNDRLWATVMGTAVISGTNGDKSLIHLHYLR